MQQIEVGERGEGQRLDNFLGRLLKDVPRTHLFRVIRKGEVRVNGKRAKADTRLQATDIVRVLIALAVVVMAAIGLIVGVGYADAKVAPDIGGDNIVEAGDDVKT